MAQIAMVLMLRKACSVVLGEMYCMAGQGAIPKLVDTTVARRDKPQAWEGQQLPDEILLKDDRYNVWQPEVPGTT